MNETWLSRFVDSRHSPKRYRIPKPIPLTGTRLFELSMLNRESRACNESVIRGACASAYLGKHTALCRVLGRYKAYVDTNDIGLSSHLMLDGYWEMWVTEILAQMVRPGMVVADIGANIGYFTLLMADLVGSNGQVHSFEPNPHLVNLLNRTLMVNGFSGWVDVYQLALADRGDQTVTLVVPPDTPMNAYILPMQSNMPSGGVEVDVVRLDSRTDWQKIELAKIDVEGAEELIWAGAQGLLDKGTLRDVILEFNPHRYADPLAFLHKLCAYGFTLYRITYSSGLVSASISEILDNPGVEDIMLVLRR